MPNTPVEVSSGVTFYTKYKVSEDMLQKFIKVISIQEVYMKLLKIRWM
jgi:pyrroline-5-carboxylate reductase